MLEAGHNFLYETITDVDSRFLKAEKIGIACGLVSEFYCIDFDAHNDEPIKDIFESYINIPYIKGLIHEGKLSIYTTAGGGYHLYFIYKDEVLSGKTYAFWETKSVMIEIRGNGQYVCCWPSAGYKHISGPEYVKLTPLPNSPSFSTMMLSTIVVLFDSIVVVVPCTSRLPVITTVPVLAPVSSVIFASAGILSLVTTTLKSPLLTLTIFDMYYP
jgi:hypothetical protein